MAVSPGSIDRANGVTLPPASDPSDVLDALFVYVVATVAVWSWVGFTLAELGLYEWRTLFGVAGAASAVVAWCLWKSAPRRRSPVRPIAVVAFICVLTCAVAIFARPGEYDIDGSDGSIYLATGDALVAYHRLLFAEPVLDRIGIANWPSFFHRDLGQVPVYNFFPGGMQIDTTRNVVRPGFFHLFPVWIANLDLLGGRAAGNYASVLFGVLSIAAIWLVARQYGSLMAANVAAGLAVCNFAEIWFARFPASEVLTQYLVLAGLYLVALAHRLPERRDAALGALAGAAFGLAACTRLDALLLVVPVAVAFLGLIAIERVWNRTWTAMAAAMAIVTAQAIAHAFLVARPYTFRVMHFAFNTRSVSYAGLALPPVLLAGLAIWIVSRRGRSVAMRRALVASAVTLVIVLAAVRFAPAFKGSYATMLLTPAGLAAALIGAAWLLAEDASPASLLIVGVFLASALVYIESVRDRTAMPFLFRRFLPVVVPLALVFVGVAVARAWRLFGRARIVVLVLPIGLAVWFLGASGPILVAAPMRGVDREMASIAGRLPADSMTLTDLSAPSHFGLSLHYAFGRDVLLVQPSADTARALAALLRSLDGNGRSLFLVKGGNDSTATLSADDFADVHLEPAGSVAFPHLEMVSTLDRFPSVLRTVSPSVDLYRVEPIEAAALPLDVDIGDHDAAWCASGFYGIERDGDATFRWTTDTALIRLPRLASLPAAVMLHLRVRSPRPTDVPPAPLEVWLDDIRIGTTPPVPPGFETLALPIGDAAMARLSMGSTHLVLRTTTFRPAEHGSTDGRRLGIQVDGLRLDAQ